MPNTPIELFDVFLSEDDVDIEQDFFSPDSFTVSRIDDVTSLLYLQVDGFVRSCLEQGEESDLTELCLSKQILNAAKSINRVEKSRVLFVDLELLLRSFRRYFVTKIKWACKLKTQCLPVRIVFESVIGQEYIQRMKIRKAYQFKLKPSHKQQQQLLQIAGSCRFLWNKVLAINLDRLRNRQKMMWYQEADYWSKLWKHSEEYGFLKEAPAHCLQQKLKDLEKAFKDGLDKSQSLKRIPKFKKKERHNSFRFPEPKQIRLDNRRIKLPKIGWIGFYKSREIDGEIKNVTVSEQADDWTISIQVEQEVVQPVHASKSAIGIDLGVSQFAAMSDNTTVQPINSFRAWEKRLAKAQKQLAKKKKRSQNWKKQVKRIQKLHCKIKNLRSDFLHKLSTQLCKSHALIVVEDLKITNMSRSASGTLEKPGKQIKAKSGLNKSILDQGWGEFRRQLEYKLDWLGGVFLKVDPRHTSQRCHVCGHTEKANRQSQALFKCTACSHSENADTNAAKNILAAGHAVLACGEKAFALSMKQEPPRIGNLISV